MFFNEVFKKTRIFKEWTENKNKNNFPVYINGVSQTVKALLISQEKNATVITADAAESYKLQQELFALNKDAVVLEARDFNIRNVSGYSKEYEHKRINTLSKVVDGDFDVLIVDAEALTEKCISKDELIKNKTVFSVNKEYNHNEILEKLILMGYVKTEQIEGCGQFSKRGDILDIFSPNLTNPVRIDFFDNEIERISFFDTDSQRRLNEIKEITILPASEQQEVDIEALVKYKNAQKNITLKNNIENDINKGDYFNDRYMAFYKNPSSTVFDYIKGIVFISELTNIKNRLKTLNDSRNLEKTALIEEGFLSKKTDVFYLQKADIFSKLEKFNIVYLDALLASKNELPPKSLINCDIKTLPLFQGNTELLIKDILEYNATLTVVLTAGEKSAFGLNELLNKNKIKTTLLNNNEIPIKGKYVTAGSLLSSLYFPSDNILIISNGEAVKKQRKRKFKSGKAINSLNELKIGDYVVHYAHGIGRFEGIHQLKNDNITKDYIKIKYKGDDCLYVPVTQLDLVSKYIGAKEDGRIVLNKLGGTEWQKATTKVKAAVKEMAKQLADLYAKRMNEKGHAFLQDTTMQDDFEDLFDYEETEDQLKAIEEIKNDMEKPSPMDRLLCGDVGFGKTEVALRAAFKCIDGGKQCAILVPTTLLANQHFLTTQKRFQNFPINIELLSRYRTKKQIEKSLNAIRRGTADLVIGTHRMISNDVSFKDLGLLIIDEEQRFGVSQKEKLKMLFPSVDILTLSATPIPRTLNMAMSGLRDMSSIEEAPQDRKPVQTYVCEQDNGIIVEAINKELRRGGQVFYLHNRVETIYHKAAKLLELIPNAKIGVAHGKMNEEELTGIWNDLIEHKIDILVCTTIIETGVDVSNANTLIVEDADRYGLAQLHQIRGRVGRSPRRAYAYFCYRTGKSLSDIAEKRLSAVREFTEFGSGFKIAMRDLEIRGAGNILGAEQHGNMEAVGYDMYIKLLGEAVKKEKGEEPEETIECTADLNINASIPESYIPYLTARLGIYRRIADIKNKEDSLDVIDELNDRFGPPPLEVLGLIDVALVRGVASKYGINEIIQNKNYIKMKIKDFELEKASKVLEKLGEGAALNLNDEPCYVIKVKENETPLNVLKRITERL